MACLHGSAGCRAAGWLPAQDLLPVPLLVRLQLVPSIHWTRPVLVGCRIRLSNVHTKLVILHAWPCWAEGQQVDSRNDGDLAARLGPSATRHILMPRRCEDTPTPDVPRHRDVPHYAHDTVSHRPIVIMS